MSRANIVGGMLVALLVAVGAVYGVEGARSRNPAPTLPTEVGTGSFAGQSPAKTLDELVHGRDAERGVLAPDLIVRARILRADTATIPFSPPPSPPPWKQQGRASAAPEPAPLSAALPDYRTDYTVRVSDVIRGALPTNELTVTMTAPATVSGGTAQFALLPALSSDGEYVLLLIRRPDGKYAPVGPQGVLLIHEGVIEPAVPDLPVVEALRGQPVEDVIRQIRQVSQHP